MSPSLGLAYMAYSWPGLMAYRPSGFMAFGPNGLVLACMAYGLACMALRP